MYASMVNKNMGNMWKHMEQNAGLQQECPVV